MTNIQIIALILLILRVISIGFLTGVLVQQYRLFKTTTTDFPSIRYTLFLIVTIGLLSNIIPILIDLAVLFERNYSGNFLIPYSFSNAISIAGMSVGWWFMYRTIEREQIKLKGDYKRLLDKLMKLRK